MKAKIPILAVAGVLILGGVGYALRNVFGNRGDFVISGIVEADDIHVGSKVGGRVLKVAVKEGQAVKAGDVFTWAAELRNEPAARPATDAGTNAKRGTGPYPRQRVKSVRISMTMGNSDSPAASGQATLAAIIRAFPQATS